MSKNNDLFRIPAPDRKDGEYIFYPICRVGRIVPFGYVESDDDPNILLPVEHELLLLEEAKHHLKRYSLRDVAAWLSHKSGRSISHTGLKTRVEAEQRQAKQYIDSRRLALKLQEVYLKARELEETRLGRRALTKEEADGELWEILEKALFDREKITLKKSSKERLEEYAEKRRKIKAGED